MALAWGVLLRAAESERPVAGSEGSSRGPRLGAGRLNNLHFGCRESGFGSWTGSRGSA